MRQYITVVSVTEHKHHYDVVLTDSKQAIKVEGVRFVGLGDTHGSPRHDPRLTTQHFLRIMYNNWRWEEKNGEGDRYERITLVTL